MQQPQTLTRDGVDIPIASPDEDAASQAWLKKNGDRDPYNPNQHYDLVSAFRAGLNRTDAKGNFATFQQGGHLPDTYKLPGHETFSNESVYYKQGMKAGKWVNGEYVPIKGDKNETVNPLKVAGTVAAQTVLTPAAGLRAAYELLKTGDLNKANAILEKVMQFPVDQLNDKEKTVARQLGKVLGTPIEKAGAGWEMIISSIPGAKDTVLPTLANIFGQSAAVFGMAGRAGKTSAADFLEKNAVSETSGELISGAVGQRMISPEEIAARLEGRPVKKEVVDPGAFKEAGDKSYDVVNQKMEHRKVLGDLLDQGYLTDNHIIRGTDVDYFKEMAQSGRLPMGESFEGESSISGFKISKGQDFADVPMYGSNAADHIVMIGKSDMVEGAGNAPNEVWINPSTDPGDFTYLYRGEQYSYGDLKGELGLDVSGQ